MTKEEFLKDFDDINFMYNNAMMKDSLERHIDDLLESEFEKIIDELETEKKNYIKVIGRCGYTEGIGYAIQTLNERKEGDLNE